jgi:hypothetical protein
MPGVGLGTQKAVQRHMELKVALWLGGHEIAVTQSNKAALEWSQ